MKRGFIQLLIFLFFFSTAYADTSTLKRQPMMQSSIILAEEKDNAYLGPFELSNADSSSKIQFQFAGQLRLTLDSQDNGSNDDRTNELLMNARRIRLTLKGIIDKYDLSYKIHLSAAPKSLELMDFYFNHKIKPNLQFRFGQYKTPFTRYRIQSFQRLAFVDWAIVTKYFGAERQMGIALHNGYEKPPEWGYVFGVFTGVNARVSHAIGLSKVYCEKAANPSNLADPGATAKFHPEFFVHLAYNANGIQLNSNSDAEKTGLRYSVGISSAWDLNPTDYHDFSIRVAPEILVKYYGISFLAVGYAGYSEIGNNFKMELAMMGGLFQTAYRINVNCDISFRYAFVDFRSGLTNDAHQRAMQLIADSGNDPDVLEQYKNAGLVSKEQEATLGFNLYILEHKLKWQNDIGWLRHTGVDNNPSDYLFRSQFQLTF